jgi:V8-like Glu-specific endopeptidase
MIEGEKHEEQVTDLKRFSRTKNQVQPLAGVRTMNATFRTARRLLGSLSGYPRPLPPRSRPAAQPLKLSVEQLDERTLPAMSPVSAVGSPLQGVVELQVTYPDGQVAVGTGAMIDRSHVLTAAHLLYSAKDGGYATSVLAIPAADGAVTPFGVAQGKYERVDPSWIRFNQSNPGMTSPEVEDIGLVTLNRPIGDSTGWFNVGGGAAVAAGGTYQTAGYLALAGFNGPHLFSESGQALGPVADGIGFVQRSLSLVPGQSGSPLWQASAGGAPVISAILTGTDGFSASGRVYGVTITPAVARELRKWETAQTPHSGSQKGLQHPAGTGSQAKGGSAPTLVAKAMDDYIDGGDSYDTSSGYDYTYTDSGYSYDPGSSIITARQVAVGDASWYQDAVNQGYQRLGIIDPFSNSYDYRLYSYDGSARLGYWYYYSSPWDFLNWY